MLPALRGREPDAATERFQVLTFDCYGTLIDWETGICAALGPVARGQGVASTRDELLAAFAAAEAPQQAGDARSALSGAARARARALAERFGVAADAAAAQAFGRSIRDWPAFPGLGRCARLPEAALSAGDPVQRRSRLLRAQRAQARGRVRRRLHRGGHRLVQAGSAQFRVHAGPARRAGHRARADPAHGAIAVSRPRPGQALGLATCWIDRRAGQAGAGATRAPEVEVSPDFRFATLGEMAAAHRAEVGG